MFPTTNLSHPRWAWFFNLYFPPPRWRLRHRPSAAMLFFKAATLLDLKLLNGTEHSRAFEPAKRWFQSKPRSVREKFDKMMRERERERERERKTEPVALKLTTVRFTEPWKEQIAEVSLLYHTEREKGEREKASTEEMRRKVTKRYNETMKRECEADSDGKENP